MTEPVILIPCHNEERRIASLIVRLQRIGWKNIVVIDDGSKDETGDIALGLGAAILRNSENKGKGAALRRGFENVIDHGYEMIVTIDGDGQHDPREIGSLLKPIESGEYDIVNGRRAEEDIPIHRKVGNKILNGFGEMDAQSGFRAYSLRALQRIVPRMTVNGFGTDAEILAIASKEGLRIKEVPITVSYDGEKEELHSKGIVRHFGDVILGTVYRNPLRALAVPGFGIGLVGLIALSILVGDFVTKKGYFSMPLSVIALIMLTFGGGAIMLGLVLHAMLRVMDRIER